MNTDQLFNSIVDSCTLGELMEFRDIIANKLAEKTGTPVEEHKDLSDLEERTIEHARKGSKLMGVKEYKDATGLGLKEAKDACDALWKKHGV